MNLTPLIRKLQNQLRASEAQAEKSQREAAAIREKLSNISRILSNPGIRTRSAKNLPSKRTSGGRRKMSAAARARISAAQKRRWAEYRAKKNARP
ncbi:MAG: hypothetical protein IT578_10740 [Verrucomicrobiae bacterium]|nr:hypothetical protein [Verrucomicrobiae bacterium]